MSNETEQTVAAKKDERKQKGPTSREVADRVISEGEKRKQYRQLIEQRENSVKDAEINARYWKAQYEIKYYSIEENKLRTEYGALLAEKQQVLDTIDTAVKEAVQTEDLALSAEPSQN